jgi:repressor LexA
MAQLFVNEFIRQGILLPREYGDSLASGMDIPATIREIMLLMGWKQQQLARRIGVSQGTISKWISGDHQPNVAQLEPLQHLIDHESKLRPLRGEGSATVPVMGFVGAGAEITPDLEQVPPEGLEQVDLPVAVSSDVIGFRVRGDSMLPAYREGDAILVLKEQRGEIDSYVGEEAVVRTVDGRRYLKEIQRGTRHGSYNLSSYNAKLISDVRIAWVGEIYLVVRAKQVRRVLGQSP